jgi:TusA-related sulfurtransferase
MKNIWHTQSVSFLGILKALFSITLKALPLIAVTFFSLTIITYIDEPTSSEWIKSAAYIGILFLTFFAIIGDLAIWELSHCNQNSDQDTNKTHFQGCRLYGEEDGNATIDLSGKSSPRSYLCVVRSINLIREGKILTVIDIDTDDYSKMTRINRYLELRGHTLLESTEREGKIISRILVGKEVSQNKIPNYWDIGSDI